MPEPLKSFFDAARVRRIADELQAAWPPFPRASFVAEASAGLEGLELLDRGRHIARAMAKALPREDERALEVLLRALGPPLASATGHGMEAFHHHPHAEAVVLRGLEHPDLALAAMREITKRTSCEFAIRPFLERHPATTMETLRAWVDDPNEHVRRLVSEGTRPRLPWAPRLRGFQEDPRPVLALLERLKDDPSEYVRRSVANNLNDIAKDHPDVALATCARWLEGASRERTRLVRHALRSLVKAGHPEAIRLAGGDADADVRAKVEVEPKRVRIGGKVRVRVTLTNRSSAPARVVLALRVHFVKARGKTSPKTFKLADARLEPRATTTLSKTLSLAQHSTRTHYAGVHRLELLVNGAPRRAGEFVLEE
ncbi:MAG TPA: DNA alkylation repair protein [Candidatus Thermoplasmatota archaeon]|nr:DNA alkylation repair protein [Candidatus Thermoplasmatota archaeon]